MALLSKSGIGTGNTIQSSHITNIYDALNGSGSYEIVATGSFSGTFAGSITSASFASTASFITTAQTASYVLSSVSASRSTSSSFATLAATATTASYIVNAQTASFVATAQTASYVLNSVSASFATSASRSTSASFSTSSSVSVSASFANAAMTSSYIVTAQTASYVLNSVSASFSTSSSFANTSVSASYAVSASYEINYETSSSYAETASFATSASRSVSSQNIKVTNTPTDNVNYYITFVEEPSGNEPIRVDSNILTYNPSTNIMTTTSSFASTASLYAGYTGVVYTPSIITTGSKQYYPVEFTLPSSGSVSNYEFQTRSAISFKIVVTAMASNQNNIFFYGGGFDRQQITYNAIAYNDISGNLVISYASSSIGNTIAICGLEQGSSANKVKVWVDGRLHDYNSYSDNYTVSQNTAHVSIQYTTPITASAMAGYSFE